jgi:hypothetical protein
MLDGIVAAPSFLAGTAEWVEAFTILLAVSLSVGWRSAFGAALMALSVLAAMTVLTGGLLEPGGSTIASANNRASQASPAPAQVPFGLPNLSRHPRASGGPGHKHDAGAGDSGCPLSRA